MKIIKIFLIITILSVLSLINVKTGISGDKTTEVDLSQNMICNTSMGIIKKTLKRVDGVNSVDFDVESNKATVTFDDSVTDLSKIETALTNAGFKANDKDADLMAYESLPGCCKRK